MPPGLADGTVLFHCSCLCPGTARLCAGGPGWGMGSRDQTLVTLALFLSSEMFACCHGRVGHNGVPER